MINDLRIQGIPTWKYVDNTTIAEIAPRGKDIHVQLAVKYVVEWSLCNLTKLNAAKCKEFAIDFKKCKHSFEPLFVSEKNLTVVQNAKILGLTIEQPCWEHPHRRNHNKSKQTHILSSTSAQGQCSIVRHCELLLYLCKTVT